MDCSTKPPVYSCFLSPNSLILVTGYIKYKIAAITYKWGCESGPGTPRPGKTTRTRVSNYPKATQKSLRDNNSYSGEETVKKNFTRTDSKHKPVRVSGFKYPGINIPTYKSLFIAQPTDLHRLLHHYEPPQTLRSDDQNLLALPTTSSEFGRYAFSCCAPLVWNNLPYPSVLCPVWTSSNPASKHIYLLSVNTSFLPPSDRPRLRFKPCVRPLCVL